jgi:hypothetical protein
LKPNISSVARLLAFVTGLVNQELLLKNEYRLVENRILKAHLQPSLRLSGPERTALAEIGKRLGRRLAAAVCAEALTSSNATSGAFAPNPDQFPSGALYDQSGKLACRENSTSSSCGRRAFSSNPLTRRMERPNGGGRLHRPGRYGRSERLKAPPLARLDNPICFCRALASQHHLLAPGAGRILRSSVNFH